ncbi:MAG TPA: (d)CMP kinase [Polyangiaceae bacterium]|nr:(d)CMP kinase [Polyangiaceae bacterium]
MTRREPSVAIDGPAGAGKSTVSRLVAEKLGYVLLDTGAIYRSVALAAKEAGISWDDSERVSELAHAIAERKGITFRVVDGAPRIFLDEKDVSAQIRVHDIAQGASKVSAIPAVRDALLDVQRAAAAGGGVVLEGRDIGTVVLPDAEAKFFLTASVDVRAKRRHDELSANGAAPTLAEVLADVRERDHRDSTRAVAPLRQAEDAELVDSSGLSIEEVVSRIVDRVRAIRASAK